MVEASYHNDLPFTSIKLHSYKSIDYNFFEKSGMMYLVIVFMVTKRKCKTNNTHKAVLRRSEKN